jgi:hypothetical protein
LFFGDVAQLDGNGPDDIHGLTMQDHRSGGFSVKNTFIDGFVGTDHASAPAIFRSMPEAAQMARLTQMAKRVHGSDTSASARRLDLSAINEVACNAEVPSPGRSSTSASGDNIEKSSCASASAAGDCCSGVAFGECGSAESDKPALPQAYTVRNTFIHIAAEEADSAEIRRVVQSMPHGMFKQSLQDELAAAQHTLPPPPEKAPTMPSTPTDMSFAPASIMAPNLLRFLPTEPYMHGVLPADPFMMRPTLPPFAPTDGTTDAGVATEPCGAFSPGSEVIIDGLLKAPGFNGLRGIVQSLDADTGRYSVLLIEGSRQLAKVKGENLRWAIPPPPSIHPNLIDASSFATGTPVLQLTSLV